MQYTTISNENTVNNNKKVYFKLSYIGTFSNATKIKLNQICDKYCKNTNIVVPFSPLKIGSFFSCKTLSPNFFNPMLFTNLLVQTVMLVTLAKPSAT